MSAILGELSVPQGINGKILEIGCGSGFLSKKIANTLQYMTIYAIDSSAAMISYAARKNEAANLKFLNLEFFKIAESSLGLEKFQVVVSLNAWTFFPLEPSIELLSKISKRGTKCIVVTYCRTLWSKFHSRTLSLLFGKSLYLHEPQQFVSALKAFGFEAQYIWIDPFEGSYLIRATLAK